jgi:diadenosine tetraphosphate (Ap4A) HIT family hydrolase
MTDDIRGCLACDLSAGRRELPGGVIAERPDWRVEHCVGPLGVGTLIVKTRRHVESVGDLTDAEAAAVGPLLRAVARCVDELCTPEQVYVCLWSHAGRKRGHLHFVVQPATTAAIEAHGGAYGPGVQQAMFESDVLPDRAAVEVFAEAARMRMREERA